MYLCVLASVCPLVHVYMEINNRKQANHVSSSQQTLHPIDLLHLYSLSLTMVLESKIFQYFPIHLFMILSNLSHCFLLRFCLPFVNPKQVFSSVLWLFVCPKSGLSQKQHSLLEIMDNYSAGFNLEPGQVLNKFKCISHPRQYRQVCKTACA